MHHWKAAVCWWTQRIDTPWCEEDQPEGSMGPTSLGGKEDGAEKCCGREVEDEVNHAHRIGGEGSGRCR
jgi:hypothetical protein